MKIFKAKYKRGNLQKISFVEQPAIEENFIKLSLEEELKEIIFHLSNVDKREILTPVLIPNKLIPRNAINGINEPFYLSFDEETIKEISYDVIANKNLMFNDSHTENNFEGIEVQQVFLSDKENGISPKEFEHLPSGTLFSILKINNDSVWNSILDGTFKGVSVEISLGLDEQTEKEEITLVDILNVVRKCQAQQIR
jgi:hypothetical protein